MTKRRAHPERAAHEDVATQQLTRFSPTGTFFITRPSKTRLSIWRTKSGDLLSSVNSPDSVAWSCLAWDGDERLYIGRADGRICSVQPESGAIEVLAEGNSTPIRSLCFAKNAGLFSMSSDHPGRVDISVDGRFLLSHPSTSSQAMAVSTDGNSLAVTDHTIHFYDCSTGNKTQGTGEMAHQKPIAGVCEILPGTWATFGEQEMHMNVWQRHKLCGSYRSETARVLQCTSLQIDVHRVEEPWEELLVAALCSDRTVRLFGNDAPEKPRRGAIGLIRYVTRKTGESIPILGSHFLPHEPEGTVVQLLVAYGTPSKPKFDVLKFNHPLFEADTEGAYNWGELIWVISKDPGWERLAPDLHVIQGKTSVKMNGIVPSDIKSKIQSAEVISLNEQGTEVKTAEGACRARSVQVNGRQDPAKSVEEMIRDRTDVLQQPTPEFSPIRNERDEDSLMKDVVSSEEDDEVMKPQEMAGDGDFADGDGEQISTRASSLKVKLSDTKNRSKGGAVSLRHMLCQALLTDDKQLFESCLAHTAALARRLNSDVMNELFGLEYTAAVQRKSLSADEKEALKLLHEAVNAVPARVVIKLVETLLERLSSALQAPNQSFVLCCWLTATLEKHQSYLSTVQNCFSDATAKIKIFLSEHVSRASKLNRLEWRLAHLRRKHGRLTDKEPDDTISGGQKRRILSESERDGLLREMVSSEGHQLFIDCDEDDEFVTNVVRKSEEQSERGNTVPALKQGPRESAGHPSLSGKGQPSKESGRQRYFQGSRRPPGNSRAGADRDRQKVPAGSSHIRGRHRNRNPERR